MRLVQGRPEARYTSPMDDPATGAAPISYASAGVLRARRWYWLSLVMLLVALLAAPVMAVTVFSLDRFGMLDHDMICPSCGGWGATAAVAAMAALVLACGSVFGWMLFRGSIMAIVLSGLAVLLAGLDMALAIRFYQVIQY